MLVDSVHFIPVIAICFLQTEFFRRYALGRLKTLRQIDGSDVSQEEASSALRQVVTSHLSLTALLGHAHADSHPPKSLTLTPIAVTLHRESR